MIKYYVPVFYFFVVNSLKIMDALSAEVLTTLAPFRHGSFMVSQMQYAGRDSSVGIATGYGLDSPAIESRWGGGKIFRTCPDLP
jgi:hypothetical protein